MSSEAPPTWEQFDALYARIERAEAALAVARKREQRLRLKVQQACEDLEVEAFTVFATEPGRHPFADAVVAIKEQLRAALVDEPAAAIGRQTVDAYRHDLAKLAEAQTVASVGQPPASAAADEPGETPA